MMTVTKTVTLGYDNWGHRIAPEESEIPADLGLMNFGGIAGKGSERKNQTRTKVFHRFCESLWVETIGLRDEHVIPRISMMEKQTMNLAGDIKEIWLYDLLLRWNR